MCTLKTKTVTKVSRLKGQDATLTSNVSETANVLNDFLQLFLKKKVTGNTRSFPNNNMLKNWLQLI